MLTLPQVLVLNATVIAGLMVALWLLSLRLKDASIVDIFWGLGFVVIAWVTFSTTPIDLRSILLVSLTTIWGVRLAGYLAWRNHGKGEDRRYVAMREYRGASFWWVSFFTVFVLQGVVMWVVALPIQAGQCSPAGSAALTTSATNSPMTLLSWAGVCIWAIGFVFEAGGDLQLARFKQNPANDGKIMDRGFWRFTRHPNYFGNAMINWGLFLLAVSPGIAWTVISPAIMTFFLVKVSGVALLEKNMKAKSREYESYIARTSSFLPWPPKRDA